MRTNAVRFKDIIVGNLWTLMSILRCDDNKLDTFSELGRLYQWQNGNTKGNGGGYFFLILPRNHREEA